MTPITLRVGASRRERFQFILWQNRQLIDYYVGSAFGAMPPIIAGLLRAATRLVGMDVEHQSGALLVSIFGSMDDDGFIGLWDACAAMCGWVLKPERERVIESEVVESELAAGH